MNMKISSLRCLQQTSLRSLPPPIDGTPQVLKAVVVGRKCTACAIVIAAPIQGLSSIHLHARAQFRRRLPKNVRLTRPERTTRRRRRALLAFVEDAQLAA